MRYLRISLLLLTVFILLVACFKPKADNRPLDEYLIGTWTQTEIHSYTFNDDGTVVVDKGQIKAWAIDDTDKNLLNFEYSDDANQIKVRKIDANNMEWTILGDKIKLKRSGDE